MFVMWSGAVPVLVTVMVWVGEIEPAGIAGNIMFCGISVTAAPPAAAGIVVLPCVLLGPVRYCAARATLPAMASIAANATQPNSPLVTLFLLLGPYVHKPKKCRLSF